MLGQHRRRAARVVPRDRRDLPLRRRRVRAPAAATRPRRRAHGRREGPDGRAAVSGGRRASDAADAARSAWPSIRKDGDDASCDHPCRRPRLLCRPSAPVGTRIATAAEGLALAAEFQPTEPTPGRATRTDRPPEPPLERRLDRWPRPTRPRLAAFLAAVVAGRVSRAPADDHRRSLRRGQRLRRVALVLGDAQPAVRVLVEQAARPSPHRRRCCAQRSSSAWRVSSKRTSSRVAVAQAGERIVRSAVSAGQLQVAERVAVDDGRLELAVAHDD